MMVVIITTCHSSLIKVSLCLFLRYVKQTFTFDDMEKMAREILFMIGEHKGRTKEEIENFENEGEDAISSLQYSLNYISSTFANTTLLLGPKQYDLTTANTP